VHTVVIVHVIFTTDAVTGHSEKDPIWKEKMDFTFRYLIMIGIPVFFLLSGMGSMYFETERKGFIKFAVGKINRLMLPCIVAVPLFIIPRLYFSQNWDQLGRIKKGTEIEWNLFKYVPHIMADSFVFKIGHLWFLIVLLVVVLTTYPLLAFSRRRMMKKPLSFEDLKIAIWQLVAILC